MKSNEEHPGTVTKMPIGDGPDQMQGQKVEIPRSVVLETAMSDIAVSIDNIVANYGIDPYDLHMILQMLDNRCLDAMVKISTNQVVAGLKIVKETGGRVEGGSDDRT